MSKPKSTAITKKGIEKYILVTDKNRKFCVKLGRMMLVIENKGNAFNKLGEYPIRPRMRKGWMKINGHSVNVSENEDRDEYVSTFKALNDLWITKGFLYIDPEMKLIEYELPKNK